MLGAAPIGPAEERRRTHRHDGSTIDTYRPILVPRNFDQSCAVETRDGHPQDRRGEK